MYVLWPCSSRTIANWSAQAKLEEEEQLPTASPQIRALRPSFEFLGIEFPPPNCPGETALIPSPWSFTLDPRQADRSKPSTPPARAGETMSLTWPEASRVRNITAIITPR